MTAQRPKDVNVGWMRAIVWLLSLVGIGLTVTGNSGWRILAFAVGFVFLIGSMALSPEVRHAMSYQVAPSKTKNEGEQRQREG